MSETERKTMKRVKVTFEFLYDPHFISDPTDSLWLSNHISEAGGPDRDWYEGVTHNVVIEHIEDADIEFSDEGYEVKEEA